MAIRWITCAECGNPTIAASGGTKYCRDCAAIRRKTAPTTTPQGIRLLRATTPYVRRDPGWMNQAGPELMWQVGVDVPFSWAFSKNHIYAVSRGGIHLRSAHREVRDALTSRLRLALHREGRRVVTNKVWIDIFVEKDSHRGDAINVLDGVCDAIKQAMPVDDRWYSVRRLDWEVVPNGRIYLSIGQDSEEESQVCHACGKILPLARFGRGQSACGDCATVLRHLRRHGAARTAHASTP